MEGMEGGKGGGGFVLTALVRVIEVLVVAVWKKRPQCGAAESPNSMDVQTGGCLCTLGPVLNAGGVVQSQKCWWRRRRRGRVSEG